MEKIEFTKSTNFHVKNEKTFEEFMTGVSGETPVQLFKNIDQDGKPYTHSSSKGICTDTRAAMWTLTPATPTRCMTTS